MREKIIIPVHNNRISPLFDVSRNFVLVEIEHGMDRLREYFQIDNDSVMARIEILANIRPDFIFCSAISRMYADILLNRGIDIIPGIIGDVEEVISAYIHMNLKMDRFLMPGCGWQKRFRRGRGQCPPYSMINNESLKKREVHIMKIALTADGDSLDAALDPRFGRAKGFIIYDLESGEYTFQDNTQNLNAVQGAGVQAARNVIETGASVLITGNVGPKAFTTLSAAGIDIYIGASGNVRDGIDQYNSGGLKKAGDANVEGHW